MPDKNVTCAECKAIFIITEAEQAWFLERKFNLPRRCRGCRAKRKAEAEKTEVKK